MKAVRYTQYGPPDVLQLIDLDIPVPKDHQVLIKVHNSSVNALDWRGVRAKPFLVRMANGLTRPKSTSLGADVAGRVEAVGKNVTRFSVGDEVFGAIGAGAFAEYACTSHKNLALKPANISFETAAATPVSALTALQGLRDKGKLAPGQKVLIYGASGGVGTFAVQIARLMGAEVTAVCSARNLDLIRGLGADRVIDYSREDFTRLNQKYDLVVSVNGYRSIFTYRRSLTAEGTYVCLGGTTAQILEALVFSSVLSKFDRRRMMIYFSNSSQDDMETIATWLETGKIRPVIHRSYSLNQIVDAMRYVEQGHAPGKVIINIA